MLYVYFGFYFQCLNMAFTHIFLIGKVDFIYRGFKNDNLISNDDTSAFSKIIQGDTNTGTCTVYETECTVNNNKWKNGYLLAKQLKNRGLLFNHHFYLFACTMIYLEHHYFEFWINLMYHYKTRICWLTFGIHRSQQGLFSRDSNTILRMLRKWFRKIIILRVHTHSWMIECNRKITKCIFSDNNHYCSRVSVSFGNIYLFSQMLLTKAHCLHYEPRTPPHLVPPSPYSHPSPAERMECKGDMSHSWVCSYWMLAITFSLLTSEMKIGK